MKLSLMVEKLRDLCGQYQYTLEDRDEDHSDWGVVANGDWRPDIETWSPDHDQSLHYEPAGDGFEAETEDEGCPEAPAEPESEEEPPKEFQLDSGDLVGELDEFDALAWILMDCSEVLRENPIC